MNKTDSYFRELDQKFEADVYRPPILQYAVVEGKSYLTRDYRGDYSAWRWDRVGQEICYFGAQI
jgi:hypothetical protein